MDLRKALNRRFISDDLSLSLQARLKPVPIQENNDKMENFWDRRYSEPGFAYGREPNRFFRDTIDGLTPGKLLLPGEGEGRNAIYAAGKGWDVTAIDQSRVARQKAMEWAENGSHRLRYRIMDIADLKCMEGVFDLIAILYLHLPPAGRSATHRRLSACLRKGGLLLMECFHKEQTRYGTGGPSAEELLYSEADLRDDFRNLEILLCDHIVEDLQQGKYHSGSSSIIRLLAKS
jgi:SAM-dependent methyltransferase